jgi:hypothetical protein
MSLEGPTLAGLLALPFFSPVVWTNIRAVHTGCFSWTFNIWCFLTLEWCPGSFSVYGHAFTSSLRFLQSPIRPIATLIILVKHGHLGLDSNCLMPTSLFTLGHFMSQLQHYVPINSFTHAHCVSIALFWCQLVCSHLDISCVNYVTTYPSIHSHVDICVSIALFWCPSLKLYKCVIMSQLFHLVPIVLFTQGCVMFQVLSIGAHCSIHTCQDFFCLNSLH